MSIRKNFLTAAFTGAVFTDAGFSDAGFGNIVFSGAVLSDAGFSIGFLFLFQALSGRTPVDQTSPAEASADTRFRPDLEAHGARRFFR
jgi:hypothetical protein